MLRKIGCPLLIVLLITKVVGVIMRGPSPLVWDASYYWELGELVAGGDWLLMQRPIAFRTPGYPWLLGLVQTLFDQPLLALVCIQGMLWLGTIGLTALMARDLSGSTRVAWFVVAVAIVMVSSTTYVAAVLTETLFVFAVIFHLWAIMRFTRSPSVPWALLVGLTLAAAILTRPVAMLLWIADAIYVIVRWYWIRDPEATLPCLRRAKICVGFAALVTVLCLCPWLARNHAIFGKAMMTEFVGRNIWIVTFQDGSGAGLDFPETDHAAAMMDQLGEETWSDLQTDQRWRDTWNVSKALTGSGMDDAATDRLMKAVAFDAIGESPQAFGKKTCRRLVNFWRTRATELPRQVADLEPDDPKAAAQLSADSFAGEPIWGVKVAPVDTAIRHRWSNWLTGNTFLMLATAISTMLLIVKRSTRATGLWLGAVLGYFMTVTAVLEIPAYRYRMIVEPVVLLVIALAGGSLFGPIHSPAPPSTSSASAGSDRE